MTVVGSVAFAGLKGRSSSDAQPRAAVPHEPWLGDKIEAHAKRQRSRFLGAAFSNSSANESFLASE
jgi:hypothetical protein